MNNRTYIIYNIIISMIISSCIPTQSINLPEIDQQRLEYLWNNPETIPSFLKDVTRIVGKSGYEEDICALVKPSEIQIPGQSAEDTYLSMRMISEVLVNNKSRQDLSFYQLAVQNAEIAVCFNVDDLPKGFYLATIIIHPRSNKTYDYSWVFMK